MRSSAATLGPSWHYSDISDGDGVARALVDLLTRWQVPAVPEGASVRAVEQRHPRAHTIARIRATADFLHQAAGGAEGLS